MTDGDGVVIVVNRDAGSAESSVSAVRLRERLPRAEVVEVGDDDDVAVELRKAATRATTALGAAGGDGTLSCAASIAVEHDLPLLALPAGTLNHFARDLGLASVDEAIDALRRGELVDVDLACVDDRMFLNTAAIGAYTDLVARRERLQRRIGKWPAAAVALVAVLRRAEPVTITVDGRRRRLWIGFIGSGRYDPPDGPPASRATLDDGLLDIRLVDGALPWARTRLIGALLTGRLGRSPVYEQRVAASLDLACEDGEAMTIALDGEVLEVAPAVTVAKRGGALRVFAPH